MPDEKDMAPSEFGGGGKRRGVPSASDRLTNVYRTGSEEGVVEDDGASFSGDVPVGVMRAREGQ